MHEYGLRRGAYGSGTEVLVLLRRELRDTDQEIALWEDVAAFQDGDAASDVVSNLNDWGETRDEDREENEADVFKRRISGLRYHIEYESDDIADLKVFILSALNGIMQGKEPLYPVRVHAANESQTDNP